MKYHTRQIAKIVEHQLKIGTKLNENIVELVFILQKKFYHYLKNTKSQKKKDLKKIVLILHFVK
jgi:hypothetical protein